MLTSLHIENIAIIEKTDIEFHAGFNILSGETGAGKSIVIDSINAILGERTPRDLIRTGSDYALVSAVFEELEPSLTQKVSDLGYECEEDTLLIQRRITPDGKNSIRINGLPATVAILKEIGQSLIAIHGQHDSQTLLNPSSHIGYVDAVADDADLLQRYREAYTAYQESEKEWQDLLKVRSQSEERTELLRYQVTELENADIEIGERDELICQRDFLRNSESIARDLTAAKQILNGTEEISGVSGLLFDAAERLTPCAEHFKKLRLLTEKLNGFGYEVEEAVGEIDACLEKLNVDSGLMEEIENRLDYLFRLSNKYGGTEEDMLRYLQNAQKELKVLENSELYIEQAQNRRDSAWEKVSALGRELSATRSRAAERLSGAVREKLTFLDMPKVQFLCRHQVGTLGTDGMDDMEFLISVNPGEEPKTMAKIASGGELSRIMLAIKSVLADKNDVPTLIFDEIDTGISGHAAKQVGIQLKSIAKNVQVLCVTHLAQIAAMADHHFRITKNTDGERTYTKVDRLDRPERIAEVARIMSGGEPSDTLLASAEELIDNGENL